MSKANLAERCMANTVADAAMMYTMQERRLIAANSYMLHSMCCRMQLHTDLCLAFHTFAASQKQFRASAVDRM